MIRFWGALSSQVDQKTEASQKWEKFGNASSIRNEKAVHFAKLIILDCFDILIPGRQVGWVKCGKLTLGVTAVISTLNSLKEIWRRLG
jgi:hypothetical protein